jgi:colicin import membrane protein
MARKLKAYQASLGFFDMAIAAPSMKAALEAWGADSNLFHQGVAKEADDPKVIAATMSKPGIILKRPVGSNGPFKQDAHLPKHFAQTRNTSKKPVTKSKKTPRKIDDKAARKAALAFEKEQRRRQIEARKEEAATAKERERTQKAIRKAQRALDQAEQQHKKRSRKIDAEREGLEKRSQEEEARWDEQRTELMKSLRHAKD